MKMQQRISALEKQVNRDEKITSDEMRTRAAAETPAPRDAFPLGAGFGHKGDAKRFDRSIDRAVDAVQAEKDARYLEVQADAFDAGEINAQGHSMTPAAWERSDKRAT